MPDHSDEAVDVGFLLLPGFPLMSYAAAVEPLRAANALARRRLYTWWNASPDDGPVSASNGVSVLPDVGLDAVGTSARRIFVCAGGNPSTFDDRRLFARLRRIARSGIALGGISGGPFVLARAGLLDARRCTLHWEHVPAFQETFPSIAVARSLFEIDEDRITCSGGVAALDMTLELITRDYGKALAVEVSEWFLHDQIRQGPAPQRMTLAARFDVRDERLARVVAAIAAHLETPLTRGALADIAGVSARHLERLFRARLGTSLHDHYLRERLAHAGRLRRETSLGSDEIAQASGFSSAVELRRVEKRLRIGAAAGAAPGMRR